MNTGFEQWFKMGKNFTSPLMPPLNAWGQAATTLYTQMLQENIEMIGEHFTLLSEQLKRLSQVRSPEEFFKVQKEILDENMTTAMDNSHKIMKRTLENMEECVKLCGSFRESTVHQAAKNAERTFKETTKDRE